MKKYKNNFTHKDPYTIGVEEEYMICDPLSGDLVHMANQIFDILPEKYKDRFSYELLLSEIEINTSVCNNVSESVNEKCLRGTMEMDTESSQNPRRRESIRCFQSLG